MPSTATYHSDDVGPGEWIGELFRPLDVSIGQITQPTTPALSVEFSYFVCPAWLRKKDRKTEWPAVIMIGPPTPMKPDSADAGFISKSPEMPSLFGSFFVTREQFSDMLRLWKHNETAALHMTVGRWRGKHWRIRSWGANFKLSA